MKRILISGVIVPNDYVWFYRDWLGMDCTCPADVQAVLDVANGEPLVVRINSPGGEIASGSDIYDLLHRYSGQLSIEVTGQACSAASVIAMAGHCEMASTALMMVHCVSMEAQGNHNRMEQAAEVLRTADQALCTAYMNKANMTQEQALDMMEQETWLTAARALELGLIDGILGEQASTVPMTASLFRLPSEEQMANARRVMAKNPVPPEDENNKRAAAKARLRMMRLKGAKRHDI